MRQMANNVGPDLTPEARARGCAALDGGRTIRQALETVGVVVGPAVGSIGRRALTLDGATWEATAGEAREWLRWGAGRERVEALLAWARTVSPTAGFDGLDNDGAVLLSFPTDRLAREAARRFVDDQPVDGSAAWDGFSHYLTVRS